MKLTKIQRVGMVLGIAGFVLPLVISFPGLSFAGHLGLGIFLLAAAFWMFEPIPIYSTSILIILLEVLLLSTQGPVYMDAELPTEELKATQGQWFEVSAEAVADQEVVYTVGPEGELTARTVSIRQAGDRISQINSDVLQAGMRIVSDADHKLVNYSPNSYADYFATLASPIIILFLGGFVLAEAAVKYNLDRNLTRLLLRPFGSKPKYIVLGLMLVTAVL